jgi:hypothetical protein
MINDKHTLQTVYQIFLYINNYKHDDGVIFWLQIVQNDCSQDILSLIVKITAYTQMNHYIL